MSLLSIILSTHPRPPDVAPGTTVLPDDNTYLVGETITVTVTGGPGAAANAVGLYLEGDDPVVDLPVDWKYLQSNDQDLPVSGVANGVVTFATTGVAPGSYVAHLLDEGVDEPPIGIFEVAGGPAGTFFGDLASATRDISHTFAADANYCVVLLSYEEATVTVSSVTIDPAGAAVAMTQLGTPTVNSGTTAVAFYAHSLSLSGVKTIRVVTSAAEYITIEATSFRNADNQTPAPTGTALITGTSASIPLTGVNPDGHLVMVANVNASPTINPSGGITINRQDNSPVDGWQGVTASQDPPLSPFATPALSLSSSQRIAARAFVVNPTAGTPAVERYGIYEALVPNNLGYSNPFDFNIIELVISITGAENKTIRGFYDGGTTWKWRFMPSVVGTYNFTGNWSGSAAAGAPSVPSGSFDCEDTGLYRGPLSVDPANTWYFRDARNAPFHMRAYDLHRTSPASGSFISDVPRIKSIIDTDMVSSNFNFTMLNGLFNRTGADDVYTESWWEDPGSNTQRFRPAVWAAFEDLLDHLKEAGIYAITFTGLFHQTQLSGYTTTEMQVIQRYWIARFGAFYNFFGWSPLWEWEDMVSIAGWDTTTINTIMGYFGSNDPYGRMLTIHDSADNDFGSWYKFVIRQVISNNIDTANSRQQISTQSRVESDHVNTPIIGAEDIWEGYVDTTPSHATTHTAVIQAFWGEILGGIMPLYSEWNGLPGIGIQGTGAAPPYIKLSYDFLYTYTRYREYEKTVTVTPPPRSTFNALVSSSSSEAAAGIVGEEYLVYVVASGSFTVNLSAVSPTVTFQVRWFNPLNVTALTTQPGTPPTVTGGGSPSFTSPYGSNSVLLLTAL